MSVTRGGRAECDRSAAGASDSCAPVPSRPNVFGTAADCSQNCAAAWVTAHGYLVIVSADVASVTPADPELPSFGLLDLALAILPPG